MTVPSPSAPAPGAAPRRAGAPGRRAVKITAAVALAGIVLAALGIFLATRPVHTPTQDCGTAGGFLLRGGVNEFVDPADPPEGTTAAEARDNNATPCQERAANQVRPAGALVVGGTAVALVSLFVEFALRLRLRRRARRPSRGRAEPTA
ncbi:MAG: hypothetical protein JWM47_144 [Acidimicrobiales bacterium]|nr:hypothetical protein [Acidimicrobiales bacterium]